MGLGIRSRGYSARKLAAMGKIMVEEISMMDMTVRTKVISESE